jgi:hypothetical protein
LSGKRKLLLLLSELPVFAVLDQRVRNSAKSLLDGLLVGQECFLLPGFSVAEGARLAYCSTVSICFLTRRSTVKTDSSYSLQFKDMARPGRLELPTLCLEGRRSIQLSYGRLH